MSQFNQYNNTADFYTKIRPSFVDDRIDFQFDDKNNFNEPAVVKNENIDYQFKKEYIQIFSADRDLNFYPNPADFVLPFPTQFKDIVSIEISGGNVPNITPINDHAFLYLDIPTKNLNHIYTTSGAKYFGVLALHTGNAAGFLCTDKSSTNLMKRTFVPPLTELRDIRITLRKPDHTVVILGNETEGNPIDLSIQTSFVFQLLVRERKRVGIDQDYRMVDL